MTLATLRARRDTAALWTTANPILALGELGWATDLRKGKVGDGATVWNSLPYSLGGFTEAYNSSVAQQTGFATDAYLTNSNVAIPAGQLQAKTQYRLKFTLTKTAAGVAAPVVTLRVGTLGAIGDTARCTLTFPAQTAAADTGTCEVDVTFRTIGASTVLSSWAELRHSGGTTGLSTSTIGEAQSTSGAFDSTTATFIGASVNAGASASWSVDLVHAVLRNLAP